MKIFTILPVSFAMPHNFFSYTQNRQILPSVLSLINHYHIRDFLVSLTTSYNTPVIFLVHLRGPTQHKTTLKRIVSVNTSHKTFKLPSRCRYKIPKQKQKILQLCGQKLQQKWRAQNVKKRMKDRLTEEPNWKYEYHLDGKKRNYLSTDCIQPFCYFSLSRHTQHTQINTQTNRQTDRQTNRHLFLTIQSQHITSEPEGLQTSTPPSLFNDGFPSQSGFKGFPEMNL